MSRSIQVNVRFTPEEYETLRAFTENAYGVKLAERSHLVRKALALLTLDDFGFCDETSA